MVMFDLHLFYFTLLFMAMVTTPYDTRSIGCNISMSFDENEDGY